MQKETQTKKEPIDIRQAVLRMGRKKLQEDGRLLLLAATGVGKSLLSLQIAQHCGYKYANIIVPTLVIGESWQAEVKKWGITDLVVDCITYNSCHKILEQLIQPDIIIADEIHHACTTIRMDTMRRFTQPIIGLSATVNAEQAGILSELGFGKSIEVSLDHAVENDLIAPYDFNVITFPMDGVTQNVEGGTNDRKFMTTEVQTAQYYERRIQQAKASRNSKSIEFAYLARTRFIRKLPSRLSIAKRLIAALQRKYPNGRMLVFAPDIETCEELVPQCFYHSKCTDEGFIRFNDRKSNILGSVGILSEGVNTSANIAVIVAGLAGSLHTVQKLGRLLRKTEDGKIGKAFLLVARDTQDTVWAEKSTAGLTNIKHYKIESLHL